MINYLREWKEALDIGLCSVALVTIQSLEQKWNSAKEIWGMVSEKSEEFERAELESSIKFPRGQHEVPVEIPTWPEMRRNPR